MSAANAIFVSAVVVFLLAAVIVRRWSMAVVPAVALPLFYIGMDARWWGCCGAGNAWHSLVVAVTVGVVVVTLGLVGLARLFSPTPRAANVVNILASIAAVVALVVIGLSVP